MKKVLIVLIILFTMLIYAEDYYFSDSYIITNPARLLLDTDLSSTAENPILAFGENGNTGFYESADNVLNLSINGIARWEWSNSYFGSSGTNGGRLASSGVSDTIPFVFHSSDINTGIGRAGEDQLSLIAGGIEGLRINNDSIEMPNNTWLKQSNNAGTGYVNVFRVNTSDEIEIGTILNTGSIEFETDSGVVTAINLPVSSTPAIGTEESFSFSIDSNPILKVKGNADGTGGVNSKQLQSYGGIIRNTTTVNVATYDLLATDDILLVTYTTTGAVTSLTLPTAQVIDGRVIVIKDAGGNAATNNITIDTEGAETIDGANTQVISTNYGSITIISDGTTWYLI